jgi:hypothetical protein
MEAVGQIFDNKHIHLYQHRENRVVIVGSYIGEG